MKIKNKVSSDSDNQVRADKVTGLENELKKCQGKLDDFGDDLKIILAEINVIARWINQKFGVVLIDKASVALKHICNYNEIEEISARISSTVKTKDGKVKTKFAATATPSEKKLNLRSVDKTLFFTDNESNTKQEFASDDSADSVQDPFYLDTFEGWSDDDNKSVSKNKRGRPKKHVFPNKNVETKMNPGNTGTNSKRGRPKKSKPTEEIIIDINAQKSASTCEACGKVLKDAGSLRQHKLIHKNLKPYPCPECGKCFRRKFHLKTHRLIHAGIKKHQCGYCGKLFLLPKDLIAHERTHTGERPFSCTTCPKSFNLKSHLVMHIRTHTGEKPYKCDICEKTFSQSNSLRVHKKVHQRQGTQGSIPIQSVSHEQPSVEVDQNLITIDDSSPLIKDSHLHSDHGEMVSLLSHSNSVYSSSMNVPIGNLVTFELMPISATHTEQPVSNSSLIEHQHQLSGRERLSLDLQGTITQPNKVSHEENQIMRMTSVSNNSVELLNITSVKTEPLNVHATEKNPYFY